MNESSLLLEAVTEVARLAGNVANKYFKSALAVDTKSDGSPVTCADREAERTARDWIEQRFPDDDILGEEEGTTARAGRRRWVIDPIDGTRTFVKGVPLWGTLVAVAEGEQVLAGAAFFPPLDEMLSASIGGGCWWNGVRAQVSVVGNMADAAVLTTDERFAGNERQLSGWRALSDRAQLSRSWGDCYGYLLVATGRAEVMVDGRMSPWDAAALLPAIIEAGGVFTDWSGRQTAFGGSAIATNAALAMEARNLLTGAAPEPTR